jgi:ABC-type multidrug transport system ATPase subunit
VIRRSQAELWNDIKSKSANPWTEFTVIELVDVTQHYGIRPVLKRINLRIERGELVVVVGPNGMGKTTLLGVMGGVLTPQHGSVHIDGRKRKQSIADELAIRRLAVYLPDRPFLPAFRTPREFLLAVGRLYDIDDDRLMDHVDRLLSLFELMAHGEGPIRSCSAGQQKKVGLCAALVTDAPILLLDEPFSGGLDPAGILALKRVLQRRVREQAATVVLTSPVPEIVEEIAHRIIILRDGEVAAFDTLDGLRRLIGQAGSLGDILERLLHPETTRKVEDYFQGMKP